MLIAVDDFNLVALVVPRDGVVVAGNAPETPLPASGKGEAVAAEIYVTDSQGTRLLAVMQAGQQALIPYKLAKGETARLHCVTCYASGVSHVTKLSDAPSLEVAG